MWLPFILMPRMEKSLYIGELVLERMDGLLSSTFASGWLGSLYVSSIFSVMLISEYGTTKMLCAPSTPSFVCSCTMPPGTLSRRPSTSTGSSS